VQRRAQVRRDDENVGARVKQSGNPPGGHGPAADDQHAAAIQAEREQVRRGLDGDHDSPLSSTSSWPTTERNGS